MYLGAAALAVFLVYKFVIPMLTQKTTTETVPAAPQKAATVKPVSPIIPPASSLQAPTNIMSSSLDIWQNAMNQQTNPDSLIFV